MFSYPEGMGRRPTHPKGVTMEITRRFAAFAAALALAAGITHDI